MARFVPKVVTANILRSGEVVYLCADDTWSPHHEDAELIGDAETGAVRLAAAEVRIHSVSALLSMEELKATTALPI